SAPLVWLPGGPPQGLQAVRARGTPGPVVGQSALPAVAGLVVVLPVQALSPSPAVPDRWDYCGDPLTSVPDFTDVYIRVQPVGTEFKLAVVAMPANRIIASDFFPDEQLARSRACGLRE